MQITPTAMFDYCNVKIPAVSVHERVCVHTRREHSYTCRFSMFYAYEFEMIQSAVHYLLSDVELFSDENIYHSTRFFTHDSPHRFWFNMQNY